MVRRPREKMAICGGKKEASEETSPARHRDLRLLASRTLRKHISMISATQLVGLCYSSLSTQMTVFLFPRGRSQGLRATLTAAFGVKPEELGQATLLYHSRAAQVLLVENLEEVIQLRQQLLQG